MTNNLKPTTLFFKRSQFLFYSSNIPKFLAMTATNNANSVLASLDSHPEPLRSKRQGGCVLSVVCLMKMPKIETILQVLEQCLPVRTQEWECVQVEFTSTHFRPLQDITSLQRVQHAGKEGDSNKQSHMPSFCLACQEILQCTCR